MSRAEAAARTIEIDVDGVRAGLQRVLAKPDAAKFLRELIKLVSEIALKKNEGNTLVEEGDLVRIYNEIQRQGRMHRKDATFAPGFMAVGTATIEISRINTMTLPEFITETELKALYLKMDILLALHETLHHAGRFHYSDEDYARAVCQMLGKDFDTELPRIEGEKPSDWRDRCSSFWGKELKRRCRPS